MRKACRGCGHHWFWKLGDGRFKCRKCGQRQVFRSVWDSSRLSEAAKKQLLEYFVLGVPAHRLRFRGPASTEATERFFLQIRRVLAHLEGLESPLEPHQVLARGRRASNEIILFGLAKHQSTMRARGIEESQRQELLLAIEAHQSYDCLFFAPEDSAQGYVSLWVRGERVVIGQANSGPSKPRGRDHVNGIEGFWSYSKTWLQNHRAMPAKFFHLYLAETLFRFNHSEEDLFPLIYKALKRIDSSYFD
jgi:transposase